MKETTYNTKMLGLVTLFNPNPIEAAANIMRYIHDIDTLIIWDNSPLELNLKQQIVDVLEQEACKVIWHGDGQNYCIAPAINYAWHYAKEQGYELLLIMDQDSQWESFPLYRQQIEKHWTKECDWVFTPYIAGDDTWIITNKLQFRRIFINSGTVIPIHILSAINGADETFSLDALDHDLSYRILKAGYKITCITCCILYHTIGHPRRSKHLKLFTNDYGRARTYSMTKGHIINYRKHRDIMTAYEKRKFFKEIFMWKLIRMILVEDDKIGRFKMFFKGIHDGITYKIKN